MNDRPSYTIWISISYVDMTMKGYDLLKQSCLSYFFGKELRR